MHQYRLVTQIMVCVYNKSICAFEMITSTKHESSLETEMEDDQVKFYIKKKGGLG